MIDFFLKPEKHCPARIKLILALLVLPVFFCVMSVAEGVELGTNYRFEFAASDMSEHELGNVGVSLDFNYPLAVDFSGSVLSGMGVSASGTFLLPLGMASYIDSWWILNFAAGLYLDLPLNRDFIFRPELDFDVRMNFVESDERNVHGLNADFGAKLGFSLVMDFLGFNLLFKSGADYIILPEKDNICHYFSLNVGVAYCFGGSK
ncbi:MAG: hypothetical protein ILP07_05980 [Treponema sp.]|nr:hypothetical protein [Treponema sp.]